MLDKPTAHKKIMDKAEIKQLLKNVSKVSAAALPRDIDLSIENGVLKVFIKNPTHNMQADSAAFEGWILVLKSWLPQEITSVELDFIIPIHLSGRYGNSEACHYNRFLYRLYNLSRLFPDWFFVHESKQRVVDDFMRWINSSTCLVNHSLQERGSVITTDKMERQIESWFAFEDGKLPLCKLLDIDPDKLFNQLPIGVFYNEIARKNSIFTRGASAIDLWGIGRDGDTLHLIELKCGKNNKIGVISETLFYVAVIYDTCVAENSLFQFGQYKKYADTSDMSAIKNEGKKFKYLAAHILAERYHSLFSQAVEALIHSAMLNLGITFDLKRYDYTKKVIYENNNL